jgi:hypothetical protein
MFCFEALLGIPTLCFAQTPSATNPSQTEPSAACDLAGEVFGINDLDRSFLVKRDDTGGINTVRYSKSTIFTELSTRTEARTDASIDPANINIGDRLCVKFQKPGDGSPWVIFVLTRSEVQREQLEVLTTLHRNSAFGTVARIDARTHRIVLKRIGLDGRTYTTDVDASDPVLLRKYGPDASTVASASAADWNDVRTGDQIYIRGKRNADGSRIRAALIILGGFRTVVGTVLSIDALHECIELKNVRSERILSVYVKPRALFRISPLLPDGVERINTVGGQQGWKLHPLEFADLQEGDTVTILLRVGDPPDDLHALAMVTGFGSFGLVSQHEDDQALWLLDPLNLDLP